MLVTDIDGTLLDSKGEISDYTKEMIDLIKDDVKVILASARGYYSLKSYLTRLGLDTKDQYVIAFNGARVANGKDEAIFDAPLDKDIVLKALEYLKDKEVRTYLYDDSGRYDIKKIEDIDNFMKRKVYKIVSEGDEKMIEELKDEMPNDLKDGLEVTSSLLNRFEAVKKGSTKVEAIKMLLDRTSIARTQVVACGDGDNDIGMIEYAALGVAMGNAQKSVKESADVITSDNDHDGIGQVIDMFFM